MALYHTVRDVKESRCELDFKGSIDRMLNAELSCWVNGKKMLSEALFVEGLIS